MNKGSLPIRADVDMNAANDCMKKGIEILKDPANILPTGEQTFSSDQQGQLEDLWVEFFNTPAMSVADAQKKFVDIISSSK